MHYMHLLIFLFLKYLPNRNNRIGKTRDLFKKIRDTKGIFHARMDTMKDGSSMDITKQNILR